MEAINKEYGKIGITTGGTHSLDRTYEKLTIVYSSIKKQSYISKKDVPAKIAIDNEEYWQLYSTFDVVNVHKEMPIEGVSDAQYSIAFETIPQFAIYKVVYSLKHKQVLALYNGKFYTDWKEKQSNGYTIPTRGAYTNLNNIAYFFHTFSLEIYYIDNGEIKTSVINNDLNILKLRVKQIEDILEISEEAVAMYINNNLNE